MRASTPVRLSGSSTNAGTASWPLRAVSLNQLTR